MATFNNSVTEKYTAFQMAHCLINHFSIIYLPDNISISYSVFGIPTVYNLLCHSPNSYKRWSNRFLSYSRRADFISRQDSFDF